MTSGSDEPIERGATSTGGGFFYGVKKYSMGTAVSGCWDNTPKTATMMSQIAEGR